MHTHGYSLPVPAAPGTRPLSPFRWFHSTSHPGNFSPPLPRSRHPRSRLGPSIFSSSPSLSRTSSGLAQLHVFCLIRPPPLSPSDTRVCACPAALFPFFARHRRFASHLFPFYFFLHTRLKVIHPSNRSVPLLFDYEPTRLVSTCTCRATSCGFPLAPFKDPRGASSLDPPWSCASSPSTCHLAALDRLSLLHLLTSALHQLP